jgi:hypothetical protein
LVWARASLISLNYAAARSSETPYRPVQRVCGLP